jgi:hypothetical protein
LGLYSQYLVRYRENRGDNSTKDPYVEENEFPIHPGYYISDTLLLDYPIMAISKGDIFNIGISYMIVVTTRSVWVVGPRSLDKVISYF